MTDSNVINLNDYRVEDPLFHVGILETTGYNGSEFYVVFYQDIDGERQQTLRIPEECILSTISALCEAGVAIDTMKGNHE